MSLGHSQKTVPQIIFILRFVNRRNHNSKNHDKCGRLDQIPSASSDSFWKLVSEDPPDFHRSHCKGYQMIFLLVNQLLQRILRYLKIKRQIW